MQHCVVYRTNRDQSACGKSSGFWNEFDSLVILYLWFLISHIPYSIKLLNEGSINPVPLFVILIIVVLSSLQVIQGLILLAEWGQDSLVMNEFI